MLSRITCVVSLVLACSCASTPPPAPTSIDDRDPADKALDAGRKPEELVAFSGIKAGMHVAELFAGGGYTTELLARAVGKDGVVYGVNSPAILQKFAEKPWSERLKKPVMKNVVRVDREFDDPFPQDVAALDAVLCVLNYHDFVWQNVDRKKMNEAVFKAIRPGGVYVVIDHAAVAGHHLADVQTIHRIDEDDVKAEITSAGFVLDQESDFLRNPSDTKDWSTSPRSAGEKRGTSDRFALRFKRP
jgi:predicted methyltransferase